jgi:hypothetical protein
MATSKSSTSKYRVLHRLNHNGTLYQENSIIELSESQAEELIKVDFIAPIVLMPETAQ